MNSIPGPIRLTILKTSITIWGIVSHDMAMLILSILLAVSGALRIIPMIRYAKGSHFQVLECTVISDKKSKLLNRHQLTYFTEDREEKTVTINGRILLKAGNHYRLYLSGSEEEKTISSVPDFLKPGRTMVGYELLEN